MLVRLLMIGVDVFLEEPEDDGKLERRPDPPEKGIHRFAAMPYSGVGMKPRKCSMVMDEVAGA